jgi:predicted phage terminase large subunit-like protein
MNQLVPAGLPEFAKLTPQSGPQTEFLASSADIAIYGGSAGSGKTYALLLEPLRHAPSRKDFAAVIFRRTTPEIKAPGALWDTSLGLYGTWQDAEPKKVELEWLWPGFGKVKMAHLEYEADVLNWHGAQIPLIEFDELTTFTMFQFFYLVSRNRSVCGVDPYIRATCNPDADSWVAKFIEWWIDQETGFPIPERAGKLRWFIRVKDEIRWADNKEDLRPDLLGLPTHMTDSEGNVIELDYRPLSVTFIPAKIFDNKELLKHDPSYLSKLLALPEVEKQRLLGGNWKIRPAAGLHFQRAWTPIITGLPGNTKIIAFKRGWDLAATRKTASNDPDKTATVGMVKLDNNMFVVVDYEEIFGDAGDVDEFMKRKAAQDVISWGAQNVEFSVPQDPGQAGKAQKKPIHANLDGTGITVTFSPETGDKVTRLGPFSAAAKAGRFLTLKADWNDKWFSALEGFPEGRYKDPADATGRCYNAFHDTGTGLLEYYQMEAISLQRNIANQLQLTSDDDDGACWVKPPKEGISVLYDARGKAIYPNDNGEFRVSQLHARGLRVSGWKDVEMPA